MTHFADLAEIIRLHNSGNLVSPITGKSIKQTVAICAIGGMPVKKSGYFDNELLWNGQVIDDAKLKELVKEALGTSALVTYKNPSGKTVEELGDICISLNHLWAHHWFTLSVVVTGYSKDVELAFTRDTNLKMSWCVDEKTNIFVAHGSLKQWRNFLYHRNSTDFNTEVRDVMCNVFDNVKGILHEN